MPRSKLGAVLVGGYLLVIVVAVVWAAISANGADNGEPTLQAFILTLPWSLLAAVELDVMNVNLFSSFLLTLTVLVISAAINATILYLIGTALGRMFSGLRGRI
jgi:hypothetical protein